MGRKPRYRGEETDIESESVAELGLDPGFLTT